MKKKFSTPKIIGEVVFKYIHHFSQLINLDVIRLKDINHYFGLGRLAQLVEHLVYTEGVKGSSPLLPTKTIKVGV